MGVFAQTYPLCKGNRFGYIILTIKACGRSVVFCLEYWHWVLEKPTPPSFIAPGINVL